MLSGGLMDLRDVTTRSVTLVTCLEATWQVMVERSVRSATQRFRQPTPLEGVGAADLVEALITARLTSAYASHAFAPPYPSWPFHRKAIEGAVGLLPRPILMRCEEHRRRCLAAGDGLECLSFGEAASSPAAEPENDLDRQFRHERAEADIAAFQLEASEEAPFRALLGEMLSLCVRQSEIPDDVDVEVHADPDEKRPALHGRLTFVKRGEGDREWHYCFRALGLSNATAFQTRLRAAMTASGIDRALPFRRLFVLRRDPAPGGAKSQTAQLVSEFENRGGKFIALGDGDLRIFVALSRLRQRQPEAFDAWLRARQPLCETALFQEAALCPLALSGITPNVSSGPESPAPEDSPNPSNEGAPEQAVTSELGPPADVAGEASLAVASQGRPVAIFAGSGSGRTVLLKRLIEEAALAGVPVLVVDPYGELAQLADAWPAPPPRRSAGDAAKAETFHQRVEVEVFSPGKSRAIAALPDISRLDNAEARERAIEATCVALRPYLRSGSSAPEQVVLADALRFLALRRAGSLEELVGLLEELPVGISQIGHAPAFAAQMAEQLQTALKEAGSAEVPSFDPGFFTAKDPAKTRISVISLSGLPSEEARLSYVDGLQRALRSWLAQRQTGQPLLFVLDDAQVFAPAEAHPASRESALALAREASGFGLGMIVATASPKSLDAQLVACCVTRFYGRMNAPPLIRATNDLLAQAGLVHGDAAKLSAGEFYFVSTGTEGPTKIQAPLCLSWHRPDSPAKPRPSASDIHRALSVVKEETEAG